MDDDCIPPGIFMAEVGRYERLSEARERGLVVSAMELPHWIVREGPVFVLRVPVEHREPILRELEKFEAETIERRVLSLAPSPPHAAVRLSLFVATWVMSAFWFAQNALPDWWSAAGAASSERIMLGEWWRALTALTLHGDIAHFAANLVTGLIFAGFLAGQLGGGLAWLSIIVGGGIGNVLNAAFYFRETHHSIGASTAVFGALGQLVAVEFMARLRSGEPRRKWHLVVPLGAGLGLLAFLGVGEEQSRTDFMAHLWGFLAGFVLGTLLAAARADRWRGRAIQWSAGIFAVGSLIVAWSVALRFAA